MRKISLGKTNSYYTMYKQSSKMKWLFIMKHLKKNKKLRHASMLGVVFFLIVTALIVITLLPVAESFFYTMFEG
ncbi:MAG: hypothetical protein KQH79_13970 [Bacteroidetes bacterium]|nr:hypothetical protein [Bacteroidota bacterium]